MVYVPWVRGLGVDVILWEDHGNFLIVLFEMSIVYLIRLLVSLDIRLVTYFTLFQGPTIIFEHWMSYVQFIL